MKITRIGKNNRVHFEKMLEGLPLNAGTVLGIIEDERAVGYALVNSDDASIEISQIFIEPAYRRKGLARSFVEEMKSLALDTDKDALTAYVPPDKDSEAFFKACGFLLMDDTRRYSFKAMDFYKSGRMDDMLDKCSERECVHPDELSPRMRKRLLEYCVKYSFDPVLLDKEMYDDDISFVCVDGDDISALLLSKRSGNKEAYITLIANFRRTYTGIISVLAGFAAFLYKDGRIKDICFMDVNGEALKLLKKFLPPESRVADMDSLSMAVMTVREASIPVEVQ